jgi:CRP/FNR family cyclic AMP-dependent transcriptional regulator
MNVYMLSLEGGNFMNKGKEPKDLLENSHLFKEFSPEVIMALVPLLTPARFEKNQMICLKDDDSDSLYIVAEGEVEISVSSREGKVIVLNVLSNGEVFGEIGLLDKKARTANVIARTDASLYRLSNHDFDKLAKTFGLREWQALMSYICSRFRHVTNNLEETAFLDADVRIACKIRELYEKDGNKTDNVFKITISQENLGRMAGLSREATNKALSHLEETELIKRQYKSIVIPDMKKFLKSVRD